MSTFHYFRAAEKRAIIDYVLLDPSEKVRVNVLEVPTRFKPSVIRAPVPWKTSYILSQQFCRHNLFITNDIIIRIRSTWEKRYAGLRFIDIKHLRSRMGDPLTPDEMQRRVLEQCKQTKETLTDVSKVV